MLKAVDKMLSCYWLNAPLGRTFALSHLFVRILNLIATIKSETVKPEYSQEYNEMTL